MTSKITGLVAAPFTPFLADGEINLRAIPRQAALLAANGVRGAFVGGTTGEGASLSIGERKRLAAAWVQARPASLKVIVHVGHTSLPDCIELARQAREVGADAVASIAPGFFKPADVGALVDWCGRIAAEVPNLAFYYYHIPSMSGCHHSVVDFLRQAGPRIPNLAGVKFTHENLNEYAHAVRHEDGRFDILFGRDEWLLAGLAFGAGGAVGSTYNYLAPLYQSLMARFAEGDLRAAREHQLRAVRIIDILLRYGIMAAGKAAMKFCGVDCGSVRAPLTALSPDREAALRRELEGEEFFRWCCRMPDQPGQVGKEVLA